MELISRALLREALQLQMKCVVSGRQVTVPDSESTGSTSRALCLLERPCRSLNCPWALTTRSPLSRAIVAHAIADLTARSLNGLLEERYSDTGVPIKRFWVDREVSYFDIELTTPSGATELMSACCRAGSSPRVSRRVTRRLPQGHPTSGFVPRPSMTIRK